MNVLSAAEPPPRQPPSACAFTLSFQLRWLGHDRPDHRGWFTPTDPLTALPPIVLRQPSVPSAIQQAAR